MHRTCTSEIDGSSQNCTSTFTYAWPYTLPLPIVMMYSLIVKGYTFDDTLTQPLYISNEEPPPPPIPPKKRRRKRPVSFEPLLSPRPPSLSSLLVLPPPSSSPSLSFSSFLLFPLLPFSSHLPSFSSLPLSPTVYFWYT